MLLNNYFKNKLPLLAVLTLLIGLTSCGSYQYVGQDSDGIYEPSNRRVEYREVPVRVANADVQNNNSYYKNYFKEKSLEYENESLENEIFTDIDSYEGNYVAENDSLEIAYERYGGWGQNSSEVSINIYPNYGFNNYWWHRPFYSWGWGGYYGSYYGGWGYGFNGLYWHSPYYGGYYGSFYNPYYYRNYRYSPYYNNRYYGNRYYSGRGVAYNTGRRGSTYNNRNTNFIGRNSLSRRNYSNTTRPNVRSNTTRRSNTVNANRNNTRTRINNNTTRTRVNNNSSRRVNSSNTVSRQRRSYNRSSSTPSRSRSSGTISRSNNRNSGSSTRSSSSSRPSSRRR